MMIGQLCIDREREKKKTVTDREKNDERGRRGLQKLPLTATQDSFHPASSWYRYNTVAKPFCDISHKHNKTIILVLVQTTYENLPKIL